MTGRDRRAIDAGRRRRSHRPDVNGHDGDPRRTEPLGNVGQLVPLGIHRGDGVDRRVHASELRHFQGAPSYGFSRVRFGVRDLDFLGRDPDDLAVAPDDDGVPSRLCRIRRRSQPRGELCSTRSVSSMIVSGPWVCPTSWVVPRLDLFPCRLIGHHRTRRHSPAAMSCVESPRNYRRVSRCWPSAGRARRSWTDPAS